MSNAIPEMIHRRRRQVLLHSILYYRLGETIISDGQFDILSQELAMLQKHHPKCSASVEYHLDAFKDFTGETGYHLPLMDIRATAVAEEMLKNARTREALVKG